MYQIKTFVNVLLTTGDGSEQVGMLDKFIEAVDRNSVTYLIVIAILAVIFFVLETFARFKQLEATGQEIGYPANHISIVEWSKYYNWRFKAKRYDQCKRVIQYFYHDHSVVCEEESLWREKTKFQAFQVQKSTFMKWLKDGVNASPLTRFLSKKLYERTINKQIVRNSNLNFKVRHSFALPYILATLSILIFLIVSKMNQVYDYELVYEFIKNFNAICLAVIIFTLFPTRFNEKTWVIILKGILIIACPFIMFDMVKFLIKGMPIYGLTFLLMSITTLAALFLRPAYKKEALELVREAHQFCGYLYDTTLQEVMISTERQPGYCMATVSAAVALKGELFLYTSVKFLKEVLQRYDYEKGEDLSRLNKVEQEIYIVGKYYYELKKNLTAQSQTDVNQVDRQPVTESVNSIHDTNQETVMRTTPAETNGVSNHEVVNESQKLDNKTTLKKGVSLKK